MMKRLWDHREVVAAQHRVCTRCHLIVHFHTLRKTLLGKDRTTTEGKHRVLGRLCFFKKRETCGHSYVKK